MQTIKVLAVLVVAGLFSACDSSDGPTPPTPISLRPLFDRATLIFEPALVGSWAVKGTDRKWTFEQQGDAYRLTIADTTAPPQSEERYRVRLVQLSGLLFLDFSSPTSGPFSVPAHAFARLRIEGDLLQVSFFHDAWLRQKVVVEKWLPYEMVDTIVVITAPTADLQHFVGKFALDTEAFDPESGGEMLRIKEGS